MRIRCIFHEIKDRLVTILKLVNVHLKFSKFRYLLIDNFNSIFNFKLLALYFGYVLHKCDKICIYVAYYDTCINIGCVY